MYRNSNISSSIRCHSDSAHISFDIYINTKSFSSKIPGSLGLLDKILQLPMRFPYYTLIISGNTVTCHRLTIEFLAHIVLIPMIELSLTRNRALGLYRQ